jgi:hypothetical protein
MSTSCEKSCGDIWIFYLCMIYSFNIVLYLIVWCDHIIFHTTLNICGWYFKNKNFYLYPHNLIWKEGLCKFNVLRSLKLKGWEGYTYMLIFEIIVEVSKHCTLEQFGCFDPFGKSHTKNYHVNCWLLIYLNKHVRI